jgi:uncharacterized protein YutE (UPF0331/DUF86 family)
MVNPEVIRRRLNKLDEYLSILNRLQRYSLAEFKADPERYGSAERFLQLSIEVVNDLGSHVIAEQRLGMIESYSDIPNLLADSGYLDEILHDKWIRIIGFRNILVHEYLELNRDIVHDVLQNRLGDLDELRRFFAQFL